MQAWMASGLEGHTYSPFAFGTLIACASGLRGQALRNLARELPLWEPQDSYGDDERFLRVKVLQDLNRRGQLLMHECVWGYGEPYPQPPKEGSDLAQVWQEDRLFAQLFVPLRWRDPHFFRTWWRRLGAGLCLGLRAVHQPSGRWLAYLLWRLLYGPRALPYRLGLRIQERWRRILYPPPQELPGLIRDSLPQVQLPERRIIAFALDSDDASTLRGALDNAGAAAEFFPGWTCRFYAGSGVPQAVREELAGLPNSEVAEGGSGPAELWGLAVSGDCDALLLRSPLARLGLLDLQAVTHWLASDKDLHSVHDHPDHPWDRPTPQLLGLRGGRAAVGCRARRQGGTAGFGAGNAGCLAASRRPVASGRAPAGTQGAVDARFARHDVGGQQRLRRAVHPQLGAPSAASAVPVRLEVPGHLAGAAAAVAAAGAGRRGLHGGAVPAAVRQAIGGAGAGGGWWRRATGTAHIQSRGRAGRRPG